MKLTMSQLCELIKLKKTTYANYENGYSRPTYEVLYKISLFYGISIDDLLTVDLTAKGNLNEILSKNSEHEKGNLKGNLIGNLNPENSILTTKFISEELVEASLLSAILKEIQIIRVGFEGLGQDVGQIKDKVLSE